LGQWDLWDLWLGRPRKRTWKIGKYHGFNMISSSKMLIQWLYNQTKTSKFLLVPSPKKNINTPQKKHEIPMDSPWNP